MFGLPRPISQVLQKRSQTVRIPVKPGVDFGNFWMVLTLAGFARAAYLKELVKFQVSLCDRLKPDVIFTDADPGAFLTANIQGIPLAACYASVMQKGKDSRPYQWMQQASSAALAEFHRSDARLEDLWFGKQVLKIIPSIPELEEPADEREDIRFVGSLVANFQPEETHKDYKIEEGHRYVFTYLGTGSVPVNVLKRVLPKVFPSTGTLRCLVGVQGLEQAESSAGVSFLPYIPAAQVLPYCDWTLCHGGQNTIIQSLQNSVPLIVFPGPIFERRYNARKVAQNGAGYMGELPEFTSEWFAAQLDRHSECAQHAVELAKKINALGGARAAVNALEKWRKLEIKEDLPVKK